MKIEKNYDIVIEGEPKIVTEIRHKIIKAFEDLEFYEEGHRYLLHGVQLPSVSTLSHKFKDEFDAVEKSISTAKKQGFTPQYWLDEWKYNSLKATILGTRVHAFGESLGYLRAKHPELIVDEILPQYIEEKNWLIPICGKEEAVIKFMNDLPSSYWLVMNEAKVYSGKNPDETLNPKNQYCGTFDMLYYYDGDGDESKAGLCIFDYKTNKDLKNHYSRKNNIRMHEPFSEYYQESLGDYIVQLSGYQIPLEDIGLKVLDRKLIWLKDNGNYEKIKLPDVTKKLRKIL